MGGVEQYTAILSRAQAANGHAVSVFTRVSRSGRGMVADQEAGVTVLSVNPVGPNAVQQIEMLREIVDG